MVLYHPIPMYDVNSLFLLASWAMWLLNSYSVMAGGNANGSFRRILAGIVLSISSSRVATPILAKHHLYVFLTDAYMTAGK